MTVFLSVYSIVLYIFVILSVVMSWSKYGNKTKTMDLLWGYLEILLVIIFLDRSSDGLRCKVQIGETRSDERNLENCATNITCGFRKDGIFLTWVNPETQHNLIRYGFYLRERNNNQINTTFYPKFDGLRAKQVIPFSVRPFTTYNVQLILATKEGAQYSSNTVCESQDVSPETDEDGDGSVNTVIAACMTIVLLTLTFASVIFIFLFRRRKKIMSKFKLLDQLADQNKSGHLAVKHVEFRSFSGNQSAHDKNQNLDKEYDYCTTNQGFLTKDSVLRTDRQQTPHGVKFEDTKPDEIHQRKQQGTYDYCMLTTVVFVDDSYCTTNRDGKNGEQSVSTAHAQKDPSEGYHHVILGQPDTYAHVNRQNTENDNIPCDMYDQVNFK